MGLPGFDAEVVARGRVTFAVLAVVTAIVVLALGAISLITGNITFFWIAWGVLFAAICIGGRDGFSEPD